MHFYEFILSFNDDLLLFMTCFMFILDFTKDDILSFCFKIEFLNPNIGSYTFGANGQESMEQWMKSLKGAIYNSVKSIVANLENSIKKLEGIFASITISIVI